MEELKFSSENKALQYLADVTGKSIKIALKVVTNENIIRNFFRGEYVELYPGLINYMKKNLKNYKKTGDDESWSMSFETKLPKEFVDEKTIQQKEVNIENEKDLKLLLESDGRCGGPGRSFDRGIHLYDVKELPEEWSFKVSTHGGFDI